MQEQDHFSAQQCRNKIILVHSNAEAQPGKNFGKCSSPQASFSFTGIDLDSSAELLKLAKQALAGQVALFQARLLPKKYHIRSKNFLHFQGLIL
jgi:hypothetical protein